MNKSLYVVLDLETNGTRADEHDLLSLAIYDPETGNSFERFFPLELNRRIETTYINGITERDIKEAAPLTQYEVDELISAFRLDERFVLVYGELDECFLKAYFKRHRLVGLEKFTFVDIRQQIFYKWEYGVDITKDALCVALGIEGVKETHSALNDCVLEWKLFAKMDGQPMIVLDRRVYRFSDEYYVPATLVDGCPRLRKHLGLPEGIIAKEEIIRTFQISDEVFRRMASVPSSLLGTVFDRMIASEVDAADDSRQAFLMENKSKLQYLGELATEQTAVPIVLDSEAHVVSSGGEYPDKMDDLSAAIELLRADFQPAVQYIKGLIGPNAKSQSLVVDKDLRCLAVCDISSESATLEIKTGRFEDVADYTYQLLFSSAGHSCYMLRIERPKWSTGCKGSFVVSRISFAEKEKNDQARNRRRIRYAVCDWRMLHPKGSMDDCRNALGLSLAQIDGCWDGAAPEKNPILPDEKKGTKGYRLVMQWRRAHPFGTRLECMDDQVATDKTIEKWWPTTSCDMYGSMASMRRHLNDDSIRNSISDIVMRPVSKKEADDVERGCNDQFRKAEELLRLQGNESDAGTLSALRVFESKTKASKLYAKELRYCYERGIGTNYWRASVPIEAPSEFADGMMILEPERFKIDILNSRIRRRNAKPKISITYGDKELATIDARKKRLYERLLERAGEKPFRVYADCFDGKCSIGIVWNRFSAAN